MRSRIVLRAIAILIAVAALIDPVWTAGAPPRRELIAITLTTGAVDTVVAALATQAPRWQIVQRPMSGTRLPCGAGERCIAIADGSIDADPPADAGALSVIAVRRSEPPNVALGSIVLSAGHASAAGSARIELVRTGPADATELRILDRAAVVGAATHRWSSAETATVEVPWWPVAAGARTLSVEALPAEGESNTLDNSIDVGVSVGVDTSGVIVFDARPSWHSTFVRRALEDDARFEVRYRGRVAPSVTVATANTDLDASVLESVDVVIVGSPDALSASDVALLDRYVTGRGGSLMLLPERQPAGPATRFFGDGWTEQLSPAPLAIGLLRASEILRTDRVPLGAAVIGRVGNDTAGAPSIVAIPVGKGRVLISGAMDAWRYRHLGDGAFDRFWRSLVAEAGASGAALRIDMPSGLAAPGQRIPFTLRYRSFDNRSAIEARASVRCGDGAPAPIRLWPSGTIAEFSGEVAIQAGGQCAIDATVGDRNRSASIAVTDRPRHGVEATLTKLERAARTSGGVVVRAGEEAALAQTLEGVSDDSSRIVSLYPMRSAWWIIPFAACLSIEWWLRRRAGLR